MRLIATVFLWLLTTVALVVAVPSMWAQRNIIDETGYSSLAASAAEDSRLQQAMADELTAQIVDFAADNGFDLNPDMVRGVVVQYTGNDGFPGQFAQANRIAHRWMFSDAVQLEEGSNDRWLIDIAPMLNDPSLKATLGTLDLDVPQTLTVPITVPESANLQPGQLRSVATWGPWISVGSTILTGVFALLMLAAVRSRGKAIAALGVSALLVGAAGWAGLEVAQQRYLDDALNATTDDIRQVAEVMIAHAERSLHDWLNWTLVAGGALVAFGVVVSMLGGLRHRD